MAYALKLLFETLLPLRFFRLSAMDYKLQHYHCLSVYILCNNLSFASTMSPYVPSLFEVYGKA